jgi:hypothetical protein
VPLTWADITAWKHEPLATAERELRTTRRDLLDLADELATMGLPRNWTGGAAETSGTRLGTVADDLRDVVAEVSAAYTAVCDASDGVLGVVGAVDQAQEYARLSSLTISASGVVTTNELLVCRVDDTEEDVEARRARQAQVDECVIRISEALRKAEDVDADLVSVLTSIELNRIDGGKGTLAQASAIGEVEGDLSVLEPPKGGSPTQNAAWWATLSPDERALVIAQNPGWIGNRDGIDATSRDLANRNLLDTRRTHVTTRLAELEAGFVRADGTLDPVFYQDHIDEYTDLTEEEGRSPPSTRCSRVPVSTSSSAWTSRRPAPRRSSPTATSTPPTTSPSSRPASPRRFRGWVATTPPWPSCGSGPRTSSSTAAKRGRWPP